MSKVAKTTIILMVITMVSKVLGFGRELVLGSLYGASSYSDIYITASYTPNLIFAGIGVALSTTFIPLYYENRNIGGDEQANKFTNNMFNIVLILGLILSIFIFIFAEPVTKILAMGFEGQKFKDAVIFIRIMIFGGIFLSLSDIMTAILQAKGSFIIPGLLGIPYNIIIIIFMIASANINIYLLPIGTLIALIVKFMFQVPFVYRRNYRYKCILDLKDEYVKKVIYLVAPVFIGVAVDQVNIMVDRTLSSTLAEGSLSALNYANRLNGFVMGLFITTIISVIYPVLSKLSSENDKVKFSQTVVTSVNSVVLLVTPISVGAIVLAHPIVKILFQRGAFDERATNLTAIALCFYSLGMLGLALRDILSKVFYSLQDTKTPMINGALAMGLNIILNIILIKYMGHAGLAFGTSIASTICVFMLFYSLDKKIENFDQKRIVYTFIKSVLAALIMGFVVYRVNIWIGNILGNGLIHEIITLGCSIISGVIVYAILIIILKIEEVNVIMNTIKLNR